MDRTVQRPLVSWTSWTVWVGDNGERRWASLSVKPGWLWVRCRVLISSPSNNSSLSRRLKPKRQLSGRIVDSRTVAKLKVQRSIAVLQTLARLDVAYVPKVLWCKTSLDRLALDVPGGRRIALFELECDVRVAARDGCEEAGRGIDRDAVERAAVAAELVVELVGRAKGRAGSVGAGDNGGCLCAGECQCQGDGGGEGAERRHVDGFKTSALVRVIGLMVDGEVLFVDAFQLKLGRLFLYMSLRIDSGHDARGSSHALHIPLLINTSGSMECNVD